jgi:hypothetical protein
MPDVIARVTQTSGNELSAILLATHRTSRRTRRCRGGSTPRPGVTGPTDQSGRPFCLPVGRSTSGGHPIGDGSGHPIFRLAAARQAGQERGVLGEQPPKDRRAARRIDARVATGRGTRCDGGQRDASIRARAANYSAARFAANRCTSRRWSLGCMAQQLAQHQQINHGRRTGKEHCSNRVMPPGGAMASRPAPLNAVKLET